MVQIHIENATVKYQLKYADGKYSLLGNTDDYIGVQGKAIVGITISGQYGVRYRAHLLGGGWLPYVTGYGWSDYQNGWAGNGTTAIDAIQVIGQGPSTPKYTLSFSLNGGSGTAPASQTVNYGAPVTVPDIGQGYRTGYTFNGWNTTSSGSGTYVAVSSPYFVYSNTTLYAQWKANPTTYYSVYFYANGGSGSPPATQTVAYNSSITLPGAGSMYRTGYTFAGWTSSTGGTTVYSAGSTYKITSSIGFYAKWTANPKYTLTFSLNGGSGTGPAQQSVTGGSSVTLPGLGSAYRTGFTFDGWNTKPSGTGSQYAAGKSFVVSSDITLYAQWKATIGQQLRAQSSTYTESRLNHSVALLLWRIGKASGNGPAGNCSATYSTTFPVSSARTKTLSVAIETPGNATPTVTSNKAWLAVKKIQATATEGYFAVSLTALSNPLTSARTATVTVKAGGSTLTLTISQPKSSTKLKYVALGDSYSAGAGTFDYWGLSNRYAGPNDDPSPSSQATDPRYFERVVAWKGGYQLLKGYHCRRNTLAWPVLLPDASGLNITLDDFRACTGAVSEDVALRAQPTSEATKTNYPELNGFIKYDGAGSQWPTAPYTLDPDIITLTLGGNDVGFADFVQACFLGGCGDGEQLVTTVTGSYWTPITDPYYKKVVDWINNGRSGKDTPKRPLKDKLVDTYKKILDSAPNATVYVLTYPVVAPPANWPNAMERDYLYECDPDHDLISHGDLNGWTGSIHSKNGEAVRIITNALNGAIKEAVATVAASDPRIVVIEVPQSTFGHICQANNPMVDIHAIKKVVAGEEASAHPNAEGNRRIAQAAQEGILKRNS
jgi:uncharacterized repeat protein (TIGR02543 family)